MSRTDNDKEQLEEDDTRSILDPKEGIEGQQKKLETACTKKTKKLAPRRDTEMQLSWLYQAMQTRRTFSIAEAYSKSYIHTYIYFLVR